MSWRSLLERGYSTRPRWVRPRPRVSRDASRPEPPANSSAMRHQVSGVYTRREASSDGASAQQLGGHWRWMSILRCPAWMLASERMTSTAFKSARWWPVSSAGSRSSIVRLSRRPSAIATPSASRNVARSSTAAGPSERTSYELASITSVEGPWPRTKRRQARWIGSPAAPDSARPERCTCCSLCSADRPWARVRPGSAASRNCWPAS